LDNNCLIITDRLKELIKYKALQVGLHMIWYYLLHIGRFQKNELRNNKQH